MLRCGSGRNLAPLGGASAFLPRGCRPQAGGVPGPGPVPSLLSRTCGRTSSFPVTCIWASWRLRDGEHESHGAKVTWASPQGVLTVSAFPRRFLKRGRSSVMTPSPGGTGTSLQPDPAQPPGSGRALPQLAFLFPSTLCRRDGGV